ncbi:pyridoxamine 5'-phosphate oxidase family protein [Nucisporomicrobium flavum]|uniref:pyridoxamine 5'-phosphate oxidase family protein n=1 Tax=Nucisporomicrobium flavum TaxID=2785915 RepID=UPI003C2D97E7
MASWSEFTAAEPDLAAAVRALLQQYGPGMGYLATVRADGGPRVHPVSPVITDKGLYCFVVDSAKRRDLERDGRYALHSYPPEESDDEAYVTGRAHLVTDQTVVAELADALRASPRVDWRLFEFSIETAMLRRHGPAGALPLAMSLRYPPITLTWRDPALGLSTPSSAAPLRESTATVTLTTPTRDRPTPHPPLPPVADLNPRSAPLGIRLQDLATATTSS